MDSKKLEALVVSVEQGSFTRAADILGYTQSGLTHMMNSLEKDLGFAVLTRSRSGVQLTPGGQRIYPMVKACLNAHRHLEREIELVNTNREETIRVAAYASIATHWLPEVIERFRHKYPGINVDIKMGSVEEVYRWAKEDKVDMTFASFQDGSGLEWTRLRDDPLMAIVPRDYDLNGATRFSVNRFDRHEFLMPSMGFDLDIMRVLSSYGIAPNVQPTQVSDSVVISMVAHGLGISILSALVLEGRQDAVQALPLDPPAARELGILSRPMRELRPIVRRFLLFSRDMIQAI